MTDLIDALKKLEVQTGSLACLGCFHEHSCSTRGCAIIRAAIEELEKRQWISAKERMPAEHDSCFAKFYGTTKWVPGMFRKVSDPVDACVKYSDGSKMVHQLTTHDGQWSTSSIFGECEITHWMPMPELPKEE